MYLTVTPNMVKIGINIKDNKFFSVTFHRISMQYHVDTPSRKDLALDPAIQGTLPHCLYFGVAS